MQEENRNAIVCISGGVDSVTTAYYVKKVVKPQKQILIFCNYGQRTYLYEEFCISQVSKLIDAELKIIDIQWLGRISTSLLTQPEKEIPETQIVDLWDADKARQRILRWWDPCRNALLLLVALAHSESLYISNAERYDVYIGIRRESPVPMKDNTPEFLDAMNQLAEQATHHGGYRVIAPLLAYDKDKVVKLGEELSVPWHLTYSCYSGHSFMGEGNLKRVVHCGKCSNCRRRQLAFKDAGVKDPSTYYSA